MVWQASIGGINFLKNMEKKYNRGLNDVQIENYSEGG